MSQNEKSNELKQAFLSSAVSDIATYIQLADTKVSIIMASLVALFAGILACCDQVFQEFSKLQPCSWLGIIVVIFVIIQMASFILVFIFGILTIRGHSSKLEYKSKWYLSQSTKEYSFEAYNGDVQLMSDEDIIENMAAEVYKLNDIHRQKAYTTKWTIRFFAVTLISGAIVAFLLLISKL